MRSWFKKALLGVVSAGSGLVIAACYGAYYGIETLMTGRVTGGGDPIPGLRVCGSLQAGAGDCARTSATGEFRLAVQDFVISEARTDGLRVTVEDLDGETNGSWAGLTVHVPADDFVGGAPYRELVVEPRAEGQEGEGEGGEGEGAEGEGEGAEGEGEGANA